MKSDFTFSTCAILILTTEMCVNNFKTQLSSHRGWSQEKD